LAASLFERLKHETHECHGEVERRVNVLNRLQTARSYRRLLEQFYGVYCPLESEIAHSMSEIVGWLPDIEDRMRTPSLRLDLRLLGNLCPEGLPLAPIPPLDSLAQRFGCLYVLEGSTLGGQIIAREVSSRLPYTSGDGCSFFASRGAEIGPRWRNFRLSLEAYAVANSESHDSIIQSAAATFRVFGDWVEEKS
jgi:heme oxygenase (biliverdin-IX-beta and delta-forming)